MAGAATVALTYTAELKDLKKKLKAINTDRTDALCILRPALIANEKAALQHARIKAREEKTTVPSSFREN